MKRFVTYLYECQRGNKSKNVGFIRVNVRGEETTMEVYLRNLIRMTDTGRLYVLIHKQQLIGIELGEVIIENGQSDKQISIHTENIENSNFSLNDIEGIGIRLDSGCFIVSCWKDDYADEMTRGDFRVEGAEQEGDADLEQTMLPSMETMQMPDEIEKEDQKDRDTIYERIDLAQIRDLPSPNWHFATNSFLVHGFWNYGYLVLKKVLEEGKETFSLGVPGVYEKPEAVMAVLFGFPNFEKVPSEREIEQKEKNQEAEDGTFGCWFVNLKM